MAKIQQSPYIAHVFVCTNDRGGERKSCADSNSQQLKSRLKEAVAAKGWQAAVRVSACGCMGLCAQGANVLIYPHKIWFSEVSLDDVEEVMATLTQLVAAG